MKKFWLFVVVLAVLILGYQWMQYNENKVDNKETTVMSGIVGRYNSDALHLEFDYPDGVSFQETGGILIINGTQRIQLFSKSTGESLDDFVKGLLTGMNKKCIFSLQAGGLLKNTSLKQISVINDAIDTGSGNALCASPYDDMHGLSFFVVHPDDSSSVYFFAIGVVENQDVSVYDTMRFLSTSRIVQGTGIYQNPDEDIIDYVALIKGYYNAMQSHNFSLAVSFVASGEISVQRLSNSYSTALELHPFMIEAIGDTSAQFYVRYVDSGYVDYRKDQKTYVIKKTFVDSKLHSVSNNLVDGNTDLDQFMVYKDKFMSIETGKFAFNTLFGAEQMFDGRCSDRANKTQDYFSELLAKAKGKGVKYTFAFTGASLSGNKDDLSADLYVFENVFGYPNIGDFMDDFDLCDEDLAEPILINADYVVFLDSCNDKKKAEKIACKDMRGIVRQSLKFK